VVYLKGERNQTLHGSLEEAGVDISLIGHQLSPVY
jgi:hypothetical protein